MMPIIEFAKALHILRDAGDVSVPRGVWPLAVAVSFYPDRVT